MFTLILAFSSCLLYLSYLVFCPGDQCAVAEALPYTQTILQIVSTISFILALKVINALGYEKQAKKGNAKAQLMTAKNFLSGRGRTKDLNKAYFWAYIFIHAKYSQPAQLNEGRQLIAKLEEQIGASTQSRIQDKAQKYIARFNENPLNKGRKHEADARDLILSSVILVVLSAAFYVILVVLAPDTLKLMASDRATTTAVVTGQTQSTCMRKNYGVTDCISPIFEFQDETGRLIRTVGQDKEKTPTIAKFDKVPIIYDRAQPMIAVSEKSFTGIRSLCYLFGFIIFVSALWQVYILGLNYKYKIDDRAKLPV